MRQLPAPAPERAAPLAILAVLCLVLSSACASTGAGGGIPAEPRRIVVLWQPTLAAVTQLGFRPVGTAADSLDRLRPYLPAGYDRSGLRSVSTGGSAADLDPEKIIALKPDLVIGAATGNQRQAEIRSRIEEFVPVRLLPWQGNGSWRRHLRDVAEVLGAQRRADQIVADYRGRVREAKAALRPRRGETASLVRIQQPGQFRLETPASFDGQVLADLGVRQPPAGREPDPGRDYRSISGENLNRADADSIFVLPNTSNEGTASAITSNPLWPQLSAVRAGRAYQVDYAYWGAATYVGAYRIIDDVRAALTGPPKPNTLQRVG